MLMVLMLGALPMVTSTDAQVSPVLSWRRAAQIAPLVLSMTVPQPNLALRVGPVYCSFGAVLLTQPPSPAGLV